MQNLLSCHGSNSLYHYLFKQVKNFDGTSANQPLIQKLIFLDFWSHNLSKKTFDLRINHHLRNTSLPLFGLLKSPTPQKGAVDIVNILMELLIIRAWA